MVCKNIQSRLYSILPSFNHLWISIKINCFWVGNVPLLSSKGTGYIQLVPDRFIMEKILIVVIIKIPELKWFS